MSKQRAARQLVLDRQHLVQMLSDPDFFTECPVFMWLQETALLQAAAYKASEAKSCCGGKWQLIAPIANAFFDNLQKLHKLDPSHVECVRAYLSKKKHYQISAVVLFYRPADNIRPRRFAF